MRSRLRTLAVLELVNIPLIGVALYAMLGMPASAANTVGYALVALLLAEGAAYWWLKVRQLRSRAALPEGLGALRVLRAANPVLLAAGAAVVAGAAVGGAPATHVWPGAGLWAFAVLEHVNYFHVQLSHQTRADLARLWRTRRLHRSHLSRDLAAAPARPTAVPPGAGR
ncbi:hypothetical protein [Nocardiopsis trehalosi]|jgi:hypothetical protein|uniref:hypothetical protein n=1 Tax=Nocardiopsis trehalosi TaxID=109329 RepID=UPI0008296E4F|nr:hypothetical protein [Nocardiopsis trehalosi]